MSKIISVIKFLNRINKIIWKIIFFLFKFIKVESLDKLNNKPTDERYRQFKVDEPAVVEPFVTIEHKDYKQLIEDNNIKPISRRNGKNITINVHCPCCGAPKDYLYDNNGKQSQFECKVCSYIFSVNSKNEDVVLKCPHCRHILNHRVSRDDFDVYISYKTVENYCKAVSSIVHPLLEFYPIDNYSYYSGFHKTFHTISYFDYIIKKKKSKQSNTYSITRKTPSFSFLLLNIILLTCLKS